MAVFATIDVQAQFSGSAGSWTSVATDLVADNGIELRYGIQSESLMDRVAGIGSLEFALNNSNRNSAGILGYYSPHSSNVRSGFDIGLNVRLAITYSGSTFYKFVGKLDVIDPTPGQYGERRTVCTAVDWMDETTRWKLRGVTTAINARFDQAIASLIENLPNPPAASTLTQSADTVPYLFDAARDESTTAMQEFDRIARSEFGFLYVRGNTTAGGELVFEDRRTRFMAGCPVFSLNNDMVELLSNRSRNDVQPYIRLTVHPRRSDLTNETVLFSLDDVIPLAASQVVTLQAGFRDPDNLSNRVAGACVITPALGTDYYFGTSEYDNSLSANVAASTLIGSNGVVMRLHNTGSANGVLWGFQVRGQGLYDYQPLTAEMSADASAVSRYGGNVLEWNMDYQVSTVTASAIGEWILNGYVNATPDKVSGMRFVANSSSTLMVAALRAEPGMRISVAETVTGVSATYFVQAVNLSIGPRGMMYCELGLTQDVIPYINDYWVLDTDQLGTGTRLAL